MASSAGIGARSRAGGAVRDDDDVVALRDQLGRLAAEALHRALEALGPLLDRPRGVEHVGREDVVVDLLQLLDLEVAQERLADDQLVRVLG